MDKAVSRRTAFLGAVTSLIAAPLLLPACMSSSDASGKTYSPPSGNTSGDGDFFDPGPSEQENPDAPEEELEASFRAPVVSGDYLWSANPVSHRVARIHAASLEIEIFEAGYGPTFLTALPPGPTAGGALILNELSHDVSIFLKDKSGEGILPSQRIAVQEGASAWSVSSGGKYAIAWSKFGESSLNGVDGHQDLTVLDFTGETIQAYSLSVGFRPSEVFIDQQESLAYVVSEPGISVISLAGGAKIAREIFLPEGNLVGPRDIEFSPDGKLAMSRTQGSSEILLINTANAQSKSLQLTGVVSDLDMSEDGSLAVAVVRGGQSGNQGLGGAGSADQSAVTLIDPTTIFADPHDVQTIFTDEIVGSVVLASDGSHALFYTNASDSSVLSILDVGTKSFRVVDLKAPARAAYMAEDGSFAVALMSPPVGSTQSGAFALVPVAEQLPARIQGTNNVPEFVTLSADSQRALITTASSSAGPAQTFFARFPGSRVDRITLPSRALASGIVPDAGRAFVAQEHAEGRVTFIDLENGSEKTVTGFELAAKVVE